MLLADLHYASDSMLADVKIITTFHNKGKTLDRHEAQERVNQVDDPHHRVCARVKDATPTVLMVEEGSEPRHDEDEHDEHGHRRHQRQAPEVIDPAKHAIVAVQLEDLHRQKGKKLPDRSH